MGCNCNGTNQPSAKWKLTTAEDQTGKVYLSETEAKAAMSRAGGGTITRIA